MKNELIEAGGIFVRFIASMTPAESVLGVWHHKAVHWGKKLPHQRAFLSKPFLRTVALPAASPREFGKPPDRFRAIEHGSDGEIGLRFREEYSDESRGIVTSTESRGTRSIVAKKIGDQTLLVRRKTLPIC